MRSRSNFLEQSAAATCESFLLPSPKAERALCFPTVDMEVDGEAFFVDIEAFVDGAAGALLPLHEDPNKRTRAGPLPCMVGDLMDSMSDC